MTSNELKFDAADEAATAVFGAALAEVLLNAKLENVAIALIGPLGAGKTRLVQAVAKAAGVEEGTVASPTFVLVHEYAGHVPIYHFDAYRLHSKVEFAALGPEEYFTSPGWSLVEWADKIPNCLPPDRLEISILPTGQTARQLSIRALGVRCEEIIVELEHRLSLRKGRANEN
ncbi:MAG TPA: tRNA (adenosine(37)-N6)-threonylcarbamoyltransferase complex ATPase subunit type 1 TsaE [Pirellulales bacterium]|jgi:tRNA threonylcarbamoyladenosine biosynthesis protein TsaE|nr:tRNA (adenosine(37)-N6)-threonylcarbamoyltransferase complex ATPase subunit type 1 TsaE [Pirellulales bacterium]